MSEGGCASAASGDLRSGAPHTIVSYHTTTTNENNTVCIIFDNFNARFAMSVVWMCDLRLTKCECWFWYHFVQKSSENSPWQFSYWITHMSHAAWTESETDATRKTNKQTKIAQIMWNELIKLIVKIKLCNLFFACTREFGNDRFFAHISGASRTIQLYMSSCALHPVTIIARDRKS